MLLLEHVSVCKLHILRLYFTYEIVILLDDDNFLVGVPRMENG